MRKSLIAKKFSKKFTKKSANRILSLLTVSTLTITLVGAVPVHAASSNKMLEIPVNFTNTNWEADWDTTSNTEFSLWNLSEPSAFSDSYTVSYKLYIPTSFLKDESAINIGGGISLNDASLDDFPWAGYVEMPSVEFHSDGSLTCWDEATDTDIPVDYATLKKSGDFYVISYKSETKPYDPTGADTNASGSDAVTAAFSMMVKGINISAKNCAVYMDDLKIAKKDGLVLINQSFNSSKTIEGEYRTAPKNFDKPGKQLKPVTIKNNKIIYAPAKATVKVGKTFKLSAVSSPSIKVSYTSSNKKIATVSTKGIITGKNVGKAVITIKANTKSAKVSVTVK